MSAHSIQGGGGVGVGIQEDFWGRFDQITILRLLCIWKGRPEQTVYMFTGDIWIPLSSGATWERYQSGSLNNALGALHSFDFISSCLQPSHK